MDETFTQATRFMELWGEMATRMAMAGMQGNAQKAPPEAARQVRSTIFQAMAQFTDQYMRSPEFLAMLKQGFETSLKVREQTTEALTRIHHELQGVARKDVESLLRGVHQAEARIVDQLDAVCVRLDQIAERLDALDGGVGPPSEESKAPTSKKRRSQS